MFRYFILKPISDMSSCQFLLFTLHSMNQNQNQNQRSEATERIKLLNPHYLLLFWLLLLRLLLVFIEGHVFMN